MRESFTTGSSRSGGESSEHVGPSVSAGRFGLWQETGFYLNLAIAVGAYDGPGSGEFIGVLAENEGLRVPEQSEFEAEPRAAGDGGPAREWAAAAAFRLGVPFTSHPVFGHDIIYCHPASFGAAIGRTAERGFLSFAESISRIDGGV